jgi:hypothetical protein
VHMEAPIYLKGLARPGPTFREAILMHAVARLALHPHITNIQASWVKLGVEGAQAVLRAGANDLGGTLMNESISRAAGAAHGQEMPPERMEAAIRAIGRGPRQRTTLYGTPDPVQTALLRRAAACGAAEPARQRSGPQTAVTARAPGARYQLVPAAPGEASERDQADEDDDQADDPVPEEQGEDADNYDDAAYRDSCSGPVAPLRCSQVRLLAQAAAPTAVNCSPKRARLRNCPTPGSATSSSPSTSTLPRRRTISGDPVTSVPS